MTIASKIWEEIEEAALPLLSAAAKALLLGLKNFEQAMEIEGKALLQDAATAAVKAIAADAADADWWVKLLDAAKAVEQTLIDAGIVNYTTTAIINALQVAVSDFKAETAAAQAPNA